MSPPARVTRYRKIKAVGHPLAQADGQAYTHRIVLFEKIGPGVHACHWCGREVEWNAPASGASWPTILTRIAGITFQRTWPLPAGDATPHAAACRLPDPLRKG